MSPRRHHILPPSHGVVITGSGEAMAAMLFGPPETDEARTWQRIRQARTRMERLRDLREAFPSQVVAVDAALARERMGIRSDLDRLRRIKRERVA